MLQVLQSLYHALLLRRRLLAPRLMQQALVTANVSIIILRYSARLRTMYFFRGFLFLFPDALSSSEFATGVGVAEPAFRGAAFPLVVAVLFGS